MDPVLEAMKFAQKDIENKFPGTQVVLIAKTPEYLNYVADGVEWETARGLLTFAVIKLEVELVDKLRINSLAEKSKLEAEIREEPE